MKRKRLPPAPSVDWLHRWAGALRDEWDELGKQDFQRCAAAIDQAARWIEEARPKRVGRPNAEKTWSDVMMVHRLRTQGLPNSPYVDNDTAAIVAVVGYSNKKAFHRVRRKLADWRKGKRPKYSSLNLRDYRKILEKLRTK